MLEFEKNSCPECEKRIGAEDSFCSKSCEYRFNLELELAKERDADII